MNINEYKVSSLAPKYGNIECITDPSKAKIYLDGILQPVLTSTIITNILVGNVTVIFGKTGYGSYTEVSTVKQNQTTKVAAILPQIVTIIDKGIVICMGSNQATCPNTVSSSCPTTISPLDYINFIAILNSNLPITLTVRFIYSLDGVSYYTDVLTNLIVGSNIIYSFITNRRYGSNTVISLDDIILI